MPAVIDVMYHVWFCFNILLHRTLVAAGTWSLVCHGFSAVPSTAKLRLQGHCATLTTVVSFTCFNISGDLGTAVPERVAGVQYRIGSATHKLHHTTKTVLYFKDNSNVL